MALDSRMITLPSRGHCKTSKLFAPAWNGLLSSLAHTPLSYPEKQEDERDEAENDDVDRPDRGAGLERVERLERGWVIWIVDDRN